MRDKRVPIGGKTTSVASQRDKKYFHLLTELGVPLEDTIKDQDQYLQYFEKIDKTLEKERAALVTEKKPPKPSEKPPVTSKEKPSSAHALQPANAASKKPAPSSASAPPSEASSTPVANAENEGWTVSKKNKKIKQQPAKAKESGTKITKDDRPQKQTKPREDKQKQETNQQKKEKDSEQKNDPPRKKRQQTSGKVEAQGLPLDLSSYNPVVFNEEPKTCRFFVIKSYCEDDVYKSIKYNVWASTNSGNKRLDQAYRNLDGKGPLYLFFSVNGSGQFCGMAEMTSPVDFDAVCEHWAENKWKGMFTVRWIFIKDIPNLNLRHIRLENNENKPVTNSRDTQEVLMQPGLEMLKLFHNFKAKSSILDDFGFYEKTEKK